MTDGNRKPDPDPEILMKMLELEFAQKRAQRAQLKGRLNGVRALAFLFLFLVIGGAVWAYFVFVRADRLGEPHPAQSSPELEPALSATPLPAASPR